MSKDLSMMDNYSTKSSFVQLSFSRFGRTMDKTSFNSVKKAHEDEKNRSPPMGHIVIIYPGQEVRSTTTNLLEPLHPKHKQASPQKQFPSAAFQVVPRDVRQRSRIFEPEKSYENKYQPRWDMVKQKPPSFSFRNAQYPSSTRDDEHLKEYKVCPKNPILRWAESEPTSKPILMQQGKSPKQRSNQGSANKLPEIEIPLSGDIIDLEPQGQVAIEGGRMMSLSASQMNEFDSKLELERQKRTLRYALKFSRQSKRKPLAEPSVYKSEDFLNNFRPFNVNPHHAHQFDSGRGHELPIDKRNHLPSYDLVNSVNYEQLYPRRKRGHVKFGQFTDKVILRSDRDGTPPLVNVSYNPEHGLTYLYQKNPIDFDSYSPRKQNIFPNNRRPKIQKIPDLAKFKVQNFEVKPNGQIEVARLLNHTSIKT